MDRQDFVAGVPKPPRPNCSTEGCDGLVYSTTIKHCEKCIESFNKITQATRQNSGVRFAEDNMMIDTFDITHFNAQVDNPFNRAVIESLREDERPSQDDPGEDE